MARDWDKTVEKYEKKHGKAYHSYDTTSASPFNKAIKPDRAEASILADWSRFAENSITIDGRSMDSILQLEGKKQDEKGNYFKDDNALRAFFKSYLVKRMPKEQQEKAVDELMVVLHQGGIQRPATTAATFAFLEINRKSLAEEGQVDQAQLARNPTAHRGSDSINAPTAEPGNDKIIWQERTLNFVTSDKGFTLQEVVTQKGLTVTNQGQSERQILPDDPKGDKPYVYQAVMTIDVDLTGQQVETKVINSGINYGSSEAKELLDSRHWWTKLLDYAKKCFGTEGSKIEDLSQQNQDDEEIYSTQGTGHSMG